MGAFLATRTRGVYSADDSLAVTANGNMTVTVGPGLAWLKAADYWGLAVCSEAAVTLTVPTASSSAKRMDAVCLRLDKTGNKAELIVKPGTPAAMPVLPPLQRNDSYDEIYLASISLAAGQVAVSAADITDLRLNEDYCGLMRDGVTGIPTAQISAQADALMAQLREAIQAASSGEGVSVYTHQKSGTIHKLTGSGPNGRVKLTANVAAGDTVQVNGKTVPAYVGAETFADALAGEALSGRWLSFVWDGSQVNFKSGGGLSVTKIALANAKPENVLEDTTFYAEGSKSLKTGTRKNRSVVGKNGAVGISQYYPSVPVTPAAANTQTNQNMDGVNRFCLQPPAGMYDGNSYVGETYANVASAIGLTAEKLMYGQQVLGITGTGTLQAGYSYRYAYNYDSKALAGSIFKKASSGKLAFAKSVSDLPMVIVGGGGDAQTNTQTIKIGSRTIATTVGTLGTVKKVTVSASANEEITVDGDYNGSQWFLAVL